MNLRVWALALISYFGMLGLHAQTEQPADFIVAVVNSEPITNSEVRSEVERIQADAQRQHQNLPALSELRQQVLERLVNEHAQMQLAAETGIRVDDAAIDQAEATVAQQNQMDIAKLHAHLEQDGVSVSQFRAQLRRQMVLSRLQEREINASIRVTDTDVDRAIQDQNVANADPMAQEINLAQLLVAVPENATPAQIAALQAKADKLQARLRAGEDFAQLVQTESDAERSNGGALGLRRAERYPLSFVQATQALPVGAVSAVVRSGAGFHILKVLARQAPSDLSRTVVQSHARHILLRTSPQLSQEQAVARLKELRQRIIDGKDSFASLARLNSQDGSAAQGGDLGWVNPGTFVPEFEAPMDRLAPGQISEPVVSRFGVHLIQLMERRPVELGPREVRELVRSQLHEKRYEEAFARWAQDVRARAFVEYRDPPQ